MENFATKLTIFQEDGNNCQKKGLDKANKLFFLKKFLHTFNPIAKYNKILSWNN